MPRQHDMVMSSATEISSCGDSIPSLATSSTISGSTIMLLTSQLKPNMEMTMPTAHVIMELTTAANMGLQAHVCDEQQWPTATEREGRKVHSLSVSVWWNRIAGEPALKMSTCCQASRQLQPSSTACTEPCKANWQHAPSQRITQGVGIRVWFVGIVTQHGTCQHPAGDCHTPECWD